MTDLPLGVALLITIISVAVWLVHFHLLETIIVYGTSFAVAILIAIGLTLMRWYEKQKLKP